MNTKAKKWFWILVLAQAVFLLGWAGYHEYVRTHAQVILLKGRPVDPQDLLRGDFLTMNYDISSVPLPPRTIKADGSEIWVLLERKDRYYVVAQASYEKLSPGAAQILVRGTSGYNWGPRNDATQRIDYGIEKYFVPEGKGSPSFKLMEVEVSVSPAHRLYIKRVLLDGKAFP
jgi:uncharacterized membrane-anchored protein